MFAVKFFSLIIYSIGITIFLHYVSLSYLYTYYKDWFLCDIKNSSSFDYIIVGAGSAGSVLAERLSKAGAKILLIEAGGTPSYFFNIPVIAPILFNSVYDWQYKTVPQEYSCKGLINNQSIWTSGKILGGSSRLNNMIYVQGHHEDYWPWFSDYSAPTVSNGGLLHVDDQNWHSELSETILQGAAELSHPSCNINTESTTGFMKAQVTMKNGERWSADRFISQRNSNSKLKILINSVVTKVLVNSKVARGVEVFRMGRKLTFFARKGVILSAGTVGTPKILMLSGIGPKRYLDELNINTVSDLPVGQNLMDHVITGLDLVVLNTSQALSVSDMINPLSMMNYYLSGSGPWTSAGVDVIGTFRSKFAKNQSSQPDLQIMTIPGGLSKDGGILLRKLLGVTDMIFNEYFAPFTYDNTISIAPVLLHPDSRGEIRLKSSDPFDDMIIDPKYLSKEQDVLTLLEGIEFVKSLVQTEAMKKIGAQINQNVFPGCETFHFDSVEYWKCYIKHLTLTTYHPVGTCKMGEVVDTDFKVYGLKNLLVVDASVFPTLPSGNIYAPVVMLAEKAARLITQSFQNSFKRRRCHITDIFKSSR
ncbi:hypothetical protein QAD02_023901 [Eretmocerus hayati]|uniref:Uncharacterized protein n=1 Tax=Eretmocerus hayati TaxID=131215 RepID=A0ACC2PZB0_9HYME|nr:hypothetical protein QAD02_023901 [Eretmocerus hayati]